MKPPKLGESGVLWRAIAAAASHLCCCLQGPFTESQPVQQGSRRGTGRRRAERRRGSIPLSLLVSLRQDWVPGLLRRERWVAMAISGRSHVQNRMDSHTTTHLCDGGKSILLVWN